MFFFIKDISNDDYTKIQVDFGLFFDKFSFEDINFDLFVSFLFLMVIDNYY